MSCPDCFAGHVHEGSPKGRVMNLHGREVYVVEPEETPIRGIIIIVPDAFGLPFINNKLLADHYAEKGNFRVYLPDFMDGRAAPIWALEAIRGFQQRSKTVMDYVWKPYYLGMTMLGMVPFMAYNRFGLAWPKIKPFFEAVREDEGAMLPMGVAGFCWGGKPVFCLAHDLKASNGKPLIDAGFVGHPSFLDIPSDIEKVTVPISVAIGDKDPVVSAPQAAQIKDILENKIAASGQLVMYVGVGHGFCIRADLDVLDAEKQATEAEEQAISWFTRVFSEVKY